MSPHLFTHMFYGGTIISTRKLVYDAGSAEEAIKALMQAQHKAVLKDLKKGNFDDKIDEYLGTTPGLLPRGSADPGAGRDSEPVLPAPSPRSEQDVAPEGESELTSEPHAAPVLAPDRASSPAGGPSSAVAAAVPRTATHTKTDERERPTISDEVAAARSTLPQAADSSEILIQLELDDSDATSQASRTRAVRDTEVQSGTDAGNGLSDGVPGAIGGSRGQGEATMPVMPPPERRTGDRGSAVGAASLPPARQITRPPTRPAFSPQAVMSRPVSSDEARSGRESDAVEVYAPAPPSADAPPGAGSERPGQYAQYRRASTKIPIEVIKGERERSGATPIPSGLARPRTTPPAVPTTAAAARPPPPIPPSRAPEQGPRPEHRPRTPTPARISPSGAVPSRAGAGSSGVVMTRPAVIVGAPTKPASPPRVRKAREEEGRGFGQGLISEKSLDEVILAYLSEDADEK